MKIELHCHTSRYSPCGQCAPADLMERLRRAGYEAVYLTEHDAVWPAEEVEALRAACPGIGIFPGVELAIKSCAGRPAEGHLLVLGTSDPAYVGIGDAAEAIRRADGEGHLTILAHPFRWERGAEVLEGPVLPDAIEHRTNNHDEAMGRGSVAAAAALGLQLVNAGDTHAESFVGKFWIETFRPVVEADDIRAIIRAGAYENRWG